MRCQIKKGLRWPRCSATTVLPVFVYPAPMATPMRLGVNRATHSNLCHDRRAGLHTIVEDHAMSTEEIPTNATPLRQPPPRPQPRRTVRSPGC